MSRMKSTSVVSPDDDIGCVHKQVYCDYVTARSEFRSTLQEEMSKTEYSLPWLLNLFSLRNRTISAINGTKFLPRSTYVADQLIDEVPSEQLFQEFLARTPNFPSHEMHHTLTPQTELSISTYRRYITGRPDGKSHRKWRETKQQQPSRARSNRP